ncbi:MAG: hypothetical protein A2945_00940 [Candidatus Liptonbacteria bacterium RIFCSPLOWO2_01_FULL_52_25]|uniref:Uncharacterized protein n=1 Tax=Candidatus Liptonbacteria bacterium RIFCSPLOWO2_01_FULL_52_25 TaxID=1798650 RepID=A0A1G2CDV2_9BACT|nr:MAG: hypothetical protein A2945_00940 [Candidatus Liptonbacteria bacterium RIFCSPLOWO2_01_FULL_52_25]
MEQKDTPRAISAKKRVLGIALIIVGLVALLTPLTPGSWLIIVGLEIFGIRLAAAEKIKAWLGKKRG